MLTATVQSPDQTNEEKFFEEIRKNKFFIATPCNNGMVTEPYLKSALKTSTLFNQYNIQLAFCTINNESLIPRARNMLTAMFLNSDFTHLMLIDSDIEFQPEDIIKMYAHNKDFVVGIYPKKEINWDNLKNSKIKNLDNKEVAVCGANYSVNFQFLDKNKKTISIENGLTKLENSGAGFVLLKRNVIEKMIKAYPNLKYDNSNNEIYENNKSVNSELKDNFYALFDTSLDEGKYLSEDYTFCKRWRDIGGDIWLEPSIMLNHYGSFCYYGNPSTIIKIK